MDVDKRRYPRILTELSGLLFYSNGVKLKVKVLEISCDGVKIRCNTIERNLITPGGCFISGGRPIELDFQIHLPENILVSGCCHIIFSRRESKDSCQIGLQFVSFENESHDNLTKYIKANSLAIAS